MPGLGDSEGEFARDDDRNGHLKAFGDELDGAWVYAERAWRPGSLPVLWIDLLKLIVDEFLDASGLLVKMGECSGALQPRFGLPAATAGELLFNSLGDELAQWNSHGTGGGLGLPESGVRDFQCGLRGIIFPYLWEGTVGRRAMGERLPGRQLLGNRAVLVVQSGFMTRGTFLLVAALAVGRLWGGAAVGPWDWKDLEAVPATFEAPHNAEPGVKAIWFAGLPFKGKATRVFAYYGAPAGASASAKAPAMVLIHGGGGTAFAEWVRMWNARGYAAIAMDTVGTVPEKATDEKTTWNPKRARTEYSGPAGWGDFTNVDLAPQEQWSYHAVAAVIRAHSLLRSFPEVDAKRVGVTGISWGGYLTSMVAGLDARFRFAAPVYGCGYLGEDSAWLKNFAELGPERARRWLGLWDPSVYVGRAKMPMLWVNGTNDFAYPPVSWQKTHRLAKGPKTLAYRVRMPHGHPQGAKPEEIFAFADYVLRKGPGPVRVKKEGVAAGKAWMEFKDGAGAAGAVAKAELAYTRDKGKWQDRKWEVVPAELGKGRASAVVPEGVTAFYMNVFDGEGRVVSGEMVAR